MPTVLSLLFLHLSKKTLMKSSMIRLVPVWVLRCRKRHLSTLTSKQLNTHQGEALQET
jgi:hypothetical protein